MTYSQFITENKIETSEITENVRYEKLTDVTRVDLPQGQYFFFKDDRLQMIYVSDDTLAKKLWSEFKRVANTGTPEKTVRSRAGKTSNQLIFANHGITASINKEDVDFIEIYPACTLEYYLGHIYREPGPFIR